MRPREYEAQSVQDACEGSSALPLVQVMDFVKGGSTKYLRINRDLLLRGQPPEEHRRVGYIELKVPLCLASPLQGSREYAAPRWLQLPRLIHQEGTLYWRLVSVLCQVSTIWRRVLATCSRNEMDWRNCLLMHVSSRILAPQTTPRTNCIEVRNVQNPMYIREMCLVELGVDGVAVEEEYDRAAEAVGRLLTGIDGVLSYEMQQRDRLERDNMLTQLTGTEDIDSAYIWCSARAMGGAPPIPVARRIRDGKERVWVAKCIWKGDKCYHTSGDIAWMLERGRENPVADANLPLAMATGWEGVLYVMERSEAMPQSRRDFLAFVGGQNCVEYRRCRRYLTRASRRTRMRFSREGCHRRAMYSCPTSICGSSICRNHHKEVIENGEDHVFVEGPALSVDVVHEAAEVPERDSESENNTDDALSCMPWPLGTYDKQKTAGHILLNGLLRCLSRPRHTLELKLGDRRFLENMIARAPDGHVSLQLPEAMLFPGLFYKGAPDGGVYGALPMCMWSKKFDAELVGLTSLRDHLLTRLCDGALQTSRDNNYITWVFGTLFNESLSKVDTRLVLSRGYYTVNQGQARSEEGCILPFDELDSRKEVKKLAASLAADPHRLKLFVTLTCNMSSHFGVAPITAALRKATESVPADESKSMWDSAVVDFTLGWERAMRHFINYLQKSDEQILGKVNGVFARWEFQDASRNLPHLHCLLKLDSSMSVEEVRDKISCATTTSYDLSENLHISPTTMERIREAGLASSWEECVEYLKDLKRMQSHDCTKAGSRCIKRRRVENRAGAAEQWVEQCRVPRHLPAREHGFREITAPHSYEALKILEDLGLAYRSKPENIPEVTEELRAGRHTYAADAGEHISPVCPLLFFITRSSTNVQICDEYFNAKYLAKYLCGPEERVGVTLT